MALHTRKKVWKTKKAAKENNKSWISIYPSLLEDLPLVQPLLVLSNCYCLLATENNISVSGPLNYCLGAFGSGWSPPVSSYDVTFEHWKAPLVALFFKRHLVPVDDFLLWQSLPFEIPRFHFHFDGKDHDNTPFSLSCHASYFRFLLPFC